MKITNLLCRCYQFLGNMLKSQKVHTVFRRIVCTMVAAAAMATTVIEAKTPTWLGPANPGAENGKANWYMGNSGVGFVSIDNGDPASGTKDFTLGNTVVGRQNLADWRSKIFSLACAANGNASITFSFTYELPDDVKSGDNIYVELRFFDKSGTNYFGEKDVLVGSATGDSKMTSYKRITIKNIFAPMGAQTADIRITANLWKPWASGIARFDDLSVTAVPVLISRYWVTIIVRAVLIIFLFVPSLVIWVCYLRQKNRSNAIDSRQD